VEGGTLLHWLLNAGITEERAQMHVAEGHVYADGLRVSDPAPRWRGRRSSCASRPPGT